MPECPSLSSDVGSSYCVKPKRDNFHMHSNVVLNPDFTIEAWASSSDVSLLQDINLSIYANRLSIDDCLVEVENDDVEGWRNIAWRIRSLNHMTEVTGFVNGKLAAQQVVPCRYLDYGLEKELADDEDVFDFFAYQFPTTPRNLNHNCHGSCSVCPMAGHCPQGRRLQSHCHQSCKGCRKDNDELECNDCARGYFKLQGYSLCRQQCPTAFPIDDAHTTCQNITSIRYVDGFRFTRVAIDWEGKNFSLIGGTDQKVKGITDPLPAVDRGVYFDGRKKFFAMYPLELHVTFTIDAWIFAQDFKSIYSTINNSGKQVFSLSRDTLNTMRFVFTDHKNNQEAFTTMGITGIRLELAWNLVSVMLDYDDAAKMTQVGLYLNGFSGGIYNVRGSTYKDSMNYQHFIGKGHEKLSYFRGFIYSFTIYSKANHHFEDRLDDKSQNCKGCIQCGETGCHSYCPKNSEVCLSTCRIDEYPIGASGVNCRRCRDECKEGCTGPANCSLCNDVECALCEDFDQCKSCIENAAFVHEDCQCFEYYSYVHEAQACLGCLVKGCKACPNKNFCEECFENYYRVNKRKCVQCDPSCRTCNGQTSRDCTSCAAGLYKQYNINVCLSDCPTGLKQVNQGCDGSYAESYTIALNTIDYEMHDEEFDFDVTGGETDDYELFDPIPIYKRGLWFDQSYLSITNLMLNHSFSIHFWVNVINDGTIFSISHGGQLFVLKTQENMINVKYTNLIDYVKGQFQYNEWCLVTCILEYFISQSTIDLFLGHGLMGIISFDSVFADSPEHLHLVGATMVGFSSKGEFINGFMYEFSIFPFVDKKVSRYIELSKCGEGYCQECPVFACLSNCKWNEYIDDHNLCQPCDASCHFGCIRPNNCNKCFDQVCSKCHDYEECDECARSATMEEGRCECIEDYFYSDLTAECIHCKDECLTCTTETHCTSCAVGYYLEGENCKVCDPDCTECVGSGISNCTACAEGNFLQTYSTICLPYCPSGMITEENSCAPGDNISFAFSSFDYEMAQSGVAIIAGEALEAEKQEEPMLIYNRGLWFGGNQFLTMKNLVFNHFFFTATWARISSPGTLVSVNRSKDPQNDSFFSLKVDENYHMQLVLEQEDLNISVGLLPTDQWKHLIMQVNWNDSYSVYSNLEEIATKNLSFTDVVDSPHYLHHIGAEIGYVSRQDFFIGFIYQVEFGTILNMDDFQIDFEADCGRNNCQACPTWQCLVECDWNEYYNDEYEHCEPCQPSCDQGCLHSDDCNRCLTDDLCKVCTDFIGECTECIANASLHDKCECDHPYIYSASERACVSCMKGCLECQDSMTCDKCVDGHFLYEKKCIVCDEACTECYGEDFMSCTSCQAGYYLQVGLGICAKQCPTKMMGYYNACVPNNESISFTFNSSNYSDKDGDIRLKNTGNLIFYYERGLFLDGEGYLDLKNLIMHHTFTIEFWVRLDSDGRLFDAEELLLKIEDSQFVVETFNALTPLRPIVLQSWTHLAFAIAPETFILYVNGSQVADSGVSIILIDSPDNQHRVGQMLIGFIYQIIFTQDFLTEFKVHSKNCPANYCSQCPPGACLLECEAQEFFDGMQCEPCQSECKKGCLRGTDCNLCTDELCSSCDNYTECHSCATHAEQNSSGTSSLTCTCKYPYIQVGNHCMRCSTGCQTCLVNLKCAKCESGYYLDEDGICQLCNPACDECGDETEENCTLCNDGYYLQTIGSVCLPHCPTGLDYMGQECTKGTNNTIELIFNHKIFENIVDGVAVIAGLGYGEEKSDPIAVYQRGIFFDGYMILNLENLIMDSKFTLEFWIRPKRGYGNLMTIGNVGFLLNKNQYVYQNNNEMHMAGIASMSTWEHLAYSVDRTSSSIYTNGKLAGTQVMSYSFIDRMNFIHMVGSSYTGNLYSLLISTYSKATFPIEQCDLGYCQHCPRRTCLIDCDWNFYLDDVTSRCHPCNEQCTAGCLRGTDCRTCEETTCEECSDFGGFCDHCIENATLNNRVCECEAPATYSIEEAKCIGCIEGCEKCSDSVSCNECHPGYFLSERICRPCDKSCETCSDASIFCPTCKRGYHKHPVISACFDFCPTWLQADGEECVHHEMKQSYAFSKQGKLRLESHGVLIHAGENSFPKIIYRRGAYLSESDFFVVNGLIINNSFTLELWILCYSPGHLFAIENIQALSINKNFSLGFGKVTVGQVDAGEWTHVVASVKEKTVALYINLISHGARLMDNFIIDKPKYDHEMATKGFVGFFYKITYANYHNNDFEPYLKCDHGYCSNCPEDQCLIECNYKEYLEGGLCEPCDPSCTEGCLKGNDCVQCVDPLCENCSNYKTCNHCVQHAKFDQYSNLCTCIDPYIYSVTESKCVDCMTGCEVCQDSNHCEICQPQYYLDRTTSSCNLCSDACKVCQDKSNLACSVCAKNYYLHANSSICQNFCPSGYEEKQNKCNEDGTRYEQSFNNFEVRGGAFGLNTTDDAHPKPVYERGMWFEMSYADLSHLVLSHTFTLQFWLNIATHGTIFSVSRDHYMMLGDEDFITVNVLGSNFQFMYTKGTQRETDFYVKGAQKNVWLLLSLSVSWIDKNSNLEVYINNNLAGTDLFKKPILDTPIYSHILGAELDFHKDKVNYFKGFMYWLSYDIRSRNIDQKINYDCGEGYANNSPGRKCLIACHFEEYLDSNGECQSCDRSCDSGCIRGSDCKNCQDQLCAVCSDFDKCSMCVPNASLNHSDECKCDNFYIYSEADDMCVKCMPGCLECDSHDSCRHCDSGYYLNNEAQCAKCDPACKTCTDGTVYNCPTCKQVKLSNADICQPQCPTGFDVYVGTCDQKTLFEYKMTFTSNDFEHRDDEVVVAAEAGHPFYAYKRGIWLDGSSTLRLKNLIVNHTFSFEFWTRPNTNGAILSIGGGKIITLAIVDKIKIKLISDEESSIADDPVSLLQWGHIGIHAEWLYGYTMLAIFHNGRAASNFRVPRPIIDSPQLDHIIGSEHKERFYTGSIYEFMVTAHVKKMSYLGQIQQGCPEGYSDGAPICLINCDGDAFLYEGDCTECDKSCQMGCLRHQDCRPCLDPSCEVCETYDTCKSCIAFADMKGDTCQCVSPHFYSADDGSCTLCNKGCKTCLDFDHCTKCNVGYFLNRSFQCQKCDRFCASCTSAENCTKCKPGTFKQFKSAFCLAHCPTGLSAENGQCDNPGLIHIEFNSLDFERGPFGIKGGSIEASDANDPTPIYKRGLWFDGNDYLTLMKFLIGPSFSLTLWVRPVYNGDLLFIEGLLQIKVQAAKIQLYCFDKMVLSSAFLLEKWNFMAYNVVFNKGLSTVDFILNSSNISGTVDIPRRFIDHPDAIHLMGNMFANQFSNFYTGFIYAIGISPMIINQWRFMSCGVNECDVCPQNICLSDCAWNEYMDEDNNCMPCDSNCDGCVRAGSCLMNIDPLCLRYQDYDKCTNCIDNASKLTSSEPCECVAPNFYSTLVSKCIICMENCEACTTENTCDVCDDAFYLDELDKCQPCIEACTSCEDETNLHCGGCSEGNFHWHESNICMPYCPLGFESDVTLCEPMYLQHTALFNNMEYEGGDMEIMGGSTFAEEGTEPTPIFKRGMFFSGEEYMTVNKCVLNHSATILFWLREREDGCIFSIAKFASETEKYNFLTISAQVNGQVNLAVHDDSPFITVGAFRYHHWVDLGITFAWVETGTKLNVYVNQDNIGSYEHDTALLDSPDFNHVIGANQEGLHNRSDYFQGFIHSFQVLQYVDEEYTMKYKTSCGRGHALLSPEDTCLIECEWFEYMENSECRPCDDTCEKGCLRQHHCRQCIDAECLECPEAYDKCIECIPGASLMQNACVCDPPSFYSDQLDACVNCDTHCKDCDSTGACTACYHGFYMKDDECVPCNENCKRCESEDKCLICAEDHYLHKEVFHCETFCPSGLEPHGDKCIQIPNYKLLYNLDQPEPVHGLIYDDPSRRYNRGMVFNGEDTIELQYLTLNYEITMTFWVWQLKSSEIFSTQTVYGTPLLTIAVDYISLEEEQLVEYSVPYAEWNLLAVSIYKDVVVNLNNNEVAKESYEKILINDQPWNEHMIGGEEIKFQGYIYEVSYLPLTQTHFDVLPSCGDAMCQNCPKQTCLISCMPHEYIEDGECHECAPSCDGGCLRANSCSQCLDPLCDECENYDTCHQCIENSSFSESNNCVCDTDYVYVSKTNQCEQCSDGCVDCVSNAECLTCQPQWFLTKQKSCQKCDPLCLDCDGPTFMNCLQCHQGFYMQEETSICMNHCPTGFKIEGQNCVASLSIEITFDTNFSYSESRGFQLIAQELSNPTLNFKSFSNSAEKGPKIFKDRGLYFDGSTNLELDKLILNQTFTIAFWLRAIADGAIFSISQGGNGEEQSENFIDIKAQQDHIVFLFAEGRNSITNLAAELEFTTWQLAALHVKWNGETTEASFLINNQPAASQTFNRPVLDRATYNHILGAEIDSEANFSSHFKGYIYQLNIHHLLIFKFETGAQQCPDLFCQTCPPDGCLSECDWNQYPNEYECASCKEECDQGCVRSSDCRLCSDQLCAQCNETDHCDQCMMYAQPMNGSCQCIEPFIFSEEDDECISCSENCLTCASKSTCLECARGFFVSSDNRCFPCDKSCKVCTGDSNWACPECNEGYYLQLDTENSMCLPYCVQGKMSIDNTCQRIDDSISQFIFFSTKNYSGGVFGIKKFGTIPVYQRGIYFSGTDYLEATNIRATPDFSIQFWVKVISDGSLFSISHDVATISVHDRKMSFNHESFSAKSTWLESHQWLHLAVAVKSNEKMSLYNNKKADMVHEFPHELKFNEEYYKFIGTDYMKSDFFSGFLHMFGYATAPLVDFDLEEDQCGHGYCKFCPPESCLMNCVVNETLVEGKCTQCEADCTEGCIRTDDCKSCVDQLCHSCSDFDWCDECVEGAQFAENHVCKCGAMLTYSLIEDSCVQCIPGCEVCTNSYSCERCTAHHYISEKGQCEECAEGCSSCASLYSCHSCNVGFIMQIHSSVCLPYCPSGFKEVDGQCTIDHEISCITLNSEEYERVYAGFEIYAGESRDSQTDDPVLVYGRGQWFDGNDFITLDGLVLNQSFSVQFWARPDAGGDVFSVNRVATKKKGEEIFMNFVVMAKYITFMYPAEGSTKALLGTGYVDKWQLFSMFCNFDEQYSNLALYVNHEMQMSEKTHGPLIDEPGYAHLLGAELDHKGAHSMHYQGFLFELCIYSFAVQPDTEQHACGPNHCEYCPVGECLIDCDYNQVLEDEECKPCPHTCPTGCIRSTDCGRCFESMCKECVDFAYCTECIHDAEMTDNGCQCNEMLFFDQSKLSCEPCSEHCVECLDADPRHCLKCAGIEIAGICYSELPTGMGSEEDLQKIIFQMEVDSTIPTEDAINGIEIEGNGLPMIQRGFYFTEGSHVWIRKLILFHDFAFKFWAKGEQYQNLLNIQSKYGYVQMSENITVWASYFEENGSFTSDVKLKNTWNLIALACAYEKDISKFSLILNQKQEGSMDFNGLVTSEAKDEIVIGSDTSFSNNFVGFLFKVEVFNYAKLVFEDIQFCGELGEQISPADICLSDCGRDHYPLEDGTCGICRPDCLNGCVRHENCNLCKDEACLMCQSFYDECEHCIEFAQFDQKGMCQCNDAYVYNPSKHICEKSCHKGCTDCILRQNQFACHTCKNGWFLQENSTTCLEFCPWGFQSEGTLCVRDEKTTQLFYEFKDKTPIVVARGEPTIIYKRGMFFDGINNYIEHAHLLIHHTFGFYAWIKLSSPGFLLDTGIFNIQLMADTVAIQYDGSELETSLEVSLHSWSILDVFGTVDAVTVQVDQNDVLEASFMTPIRDVRDKITVIGTDHTLTDFFSGLIYAYSYSLNDQFIRTSTGECPDQHCFICPFLSGETVCLEECKWNEILNDAGECVLCPQHCACANEENCNECTNTYCEECETRWDECTKCGSSTDLVDGECICKGAFIDATCFNCPYECMDCTDRRQNLCTGCREGFFLIDGFCRTTCPSLSTKLSDECMKSKSAELFNFKYDDLRNKVMSNSYHTYLGGDDFPCSEDSPTPVLSRGLYFDGNSHATIEHIDEHIPPMLADNWYTTMWMRLSSTQVTCLFSKEEIFTFYISENRIEIILLNQGLELLSKPDTHHFAENIGGLDTHVWTLLQISTTFVRDNLHISVTNASHEISLFSLPDSHFSDNSLDSRFILGCDDRNCFHGNVAEFSVSNFSNYSSITKDDNIYAACASNEWLSDGGCSPCPSFCPCYDACLRSWDCKLNADPLCADFDNFDDCYDCVEFAYFVDGVCQCAANAEYSVEEDACLCIEGYGLSSLGVCEPCRAYLEPDEIEAQYIASYEGFAVTFDRSIDIEDLESCEDIFLDTTSFGINANCTWSEPHYLLVKFGEDSSFPEEPLALHNDVVVAFNDTCGYDKSFLMVEILSDQPYPGPHVEIHSQDSFSLRCEGLEISTSVISGDIGRPLEYKWSLGSLDIGEQYSEFSAEQSSIYISADMITEDDDLEVTVYSKNYFGRVGTESKTITIKGTDEFELKVDGETTILRRERNTLRAIAEAECSQKEFYYTWGDSKGKFIENQEIVIEPNSLQPDKSYSYSIKATDAEYGATQIEFINIDVVGQDLIALIDQPDGEVSYHHGIELNGSHSYDPDDPNSYLSYRWECEDCLDRKGNPLLHDMDVTMPQIYITNDRPNIGDEFIFKLTVSKYSRTGTASVYLKVVNDIGPDVRVVPISKRVSCQQDIRIKAYVESEGETQWYWDQQTYNDVDYKIERMNYPYLIINGDSLPEASSFVYQFEVKYSDHFAKLARTIEFTTNEPPQPGDFTVTPEVGKAYSTLFTMLADDWTSEDLPIKYRVLYSKGVSDYLVLTEFSFSAETESMLCEGQLNIKLEVCDFLGSCSEKTISHTVQKGPHEYVHIAEGEVSPVSLLPHSQLINDEEMGKIMHMMKNTHSDLSISALETVADHSEIENLENHVFQAVENMELKDEVSLARIESIIEHMDIPANISQYNRVIDNLCKKFLSDRLPEEDGFRGENFLFVRKLGSVLKSEMIHGNNISLQFSIGEEEIEDESNYDICLSYYDAHHLNLIKLGVYNAGQYGEGSVVSTHNNSSIKLERPVLITKISEREHVPDVNEMDCELYMSSNWSKGHCMMHSINANLFKLETKELGLMKISSQSYHKHEPEVQHHQEEHHEYEEAQFADQIYSRTPDVLIPGAPEEELIPTDCDTSMAPLVAFALVAFIGIALGIAALFMDKISKIQYSQVKTEDDSNEEIAVSPEAPQIPTFSNNHLILGGAETGLSRLSIVVLLLDIILIEFLITGLALHHYSEQIFKVSAIALGIVLLLQLLLRYLLEKIPIAGWTLAILLLASTFFIVPLAFEFCNPELAMKWALSPAAFLGAEILIIQSLIAVVKASS